MSEIKTVTYEGKVYQINKYYLFSDDGINVVLGRLIHINRASDHPFNTCQSDLFRYAKEVSCLESVGTITPAPIELVDGAAYMFDCDSDVDVIGLFSKGGGLFVKNNGAAFNACFCTNIRLMTVESK
jgi:hypothetical protein